MLRRPTTTAVFVCSVVLAACGGEPTIEQGSAAINANDGASAHIGDDGTMVFLLGGARQSFGRSCDGSTPLCGLTLEMRIVSPAETLTDNELQLQQLGIQLETYGPQSFNDDAPSFSADVPAADLVESAQSFGSIGVAHGGTLDINLHDPVGVLTQGELTGVDVELRFPLCSGGTAFCD